MRKKMIRILMILTNIFAIILFFAWRLLYVKGFLDLGLLSIPLGFIVIAILIWINAYFLNKLGVNKLWQTMNYREYDGFNHLIRLRQGNTSSGNITEEFVWHPTEEKVFIKKIYYNNGTLTDSKNLTITI